MKATAETRTALLSSALLGVLTFFSGVPDGAAQSCVRPYPGLVLWLDGDAVDGTKAFDIANGHDGDLFMGATTALGFVGNAFAFDGLDDYLRVPDSLLGGVLESQGDFSITLWLNKFPNRTNPIFVSLQHFCGNGGLDYFIYGVGASTDYGMELVDPSCFNFETARGVAGVPASQWVALTAVYEDDTERLELYHDGQLVVQDPADPGPSGWTKSNPSRAGGLIIGTAAHAVSAPGSVHHFTGLIDEIQIYNRALSSFEITGLFEAGSAGMCKVLTLDIDIKPGSDPNCFNIDGNGVIPVAILGSATLDVLDIDDTTLLFDGLAVRVRGNKGPLCSVEFSNADLFADLVCAFADDASSWTGGGTIGTVTGMLLDGTPIEGTDSICIVP